MLALYASFPGIKHDREIYDERGGKVTQSYGQAAALRFRSCYERGTARGHRGRRCWRGKEWEISRNTSGFPNCATATAGRGGSLPTRPRSNLMTSARSGFKTWIPRV